MMGEEPIRRSWAGDWARLTGAISLPVLALDVLATRIGIVPPEAHIAVLALGFGLGLLALALGLYALADIWRSGADGAEAAITGILYASPALALLGLVVAAAAIYPRLNDVSTDLIHPPPLARADASATNLAGEQMIAAQRESYPDIGPRLYPLPIAEVYTAARTLTEERGWDIVGELPPAPPMLLAEAADEAGAEAMAEATAEPEEPALSGVLQAAAWTPAFRFVDDVALRLTETPAGTQVDMRSASRLGTHDLGQNARRIRAFLADLDEKLQESLDRDMPLAVPSPEVPAEAGEPASP